MIKKAEKVLFFMSNKGLIDKFAQRETLEGVVVEKVPLGRDFCNNVLVLADLMAYCKKNPSLEVYLKSEDLKYDILGRAAFVDFPYVIGDVVDVHILGDKGTANSSTKEVINHLVR